LLHESLETTNKSLLQYEMSLKVASYSNTNQKHKPKGSDSIDIEFYSNKSA